MERIQCPHCERASYSSDTTTRIWKCPYCHKPFLAVQGEKTGRPLSQTPGKVGDVAAE